jgi:hypothetical protein
MKRPTFDQIIVEIFEKNFKQEEKLRLVTLLWQFDYFQRTLPTLEELQRAIDVFGNVEITHESNEIFFKHTAKLKNSEASSPITSSDLQQAYKQYLEEFKETYSKTGKRDKSKC